MFAQYYITLQDSPTLDESQSRDITWHSVCLCVLTRKRGFRRGSVSLHREAERTERIAVLVTLITQGYGVYYQWGIILTATRVNVLTVICQVSGVVVQGEILVAKEVFCSACISRISNILLPICIRQYY